MDAIPGAVVPEPKTVSRATEWSFDVENAYRYQEVGWRDAKEYEVVHGIPEKWRQTGFAAVLKTKKTGHFVYFDRARECPDKHLHRIKLFVY
jgi:hypothetical protein